MVTRATQRRSSILAFRSTLYETYFRAIFAT